MTRHWTRDYPPRCPRCVLRIEDCVCAELPRVACDVEFVILRHRSEIRKPSNTGRMVVLAVAGARLVDYGLDEPLDPALAAPGTYLLYPDAPGPPAERPRRILVLDATWPQARRMAQRPILRGLPRISLPAPAATPRLRRTTGDQMSTLEAVARAVALLHGEARARPLDDLYRTLVERRLRRRGAGA